MDIVVCAMATNIRFAWFDFYYIFDFKIMKIDVVL